MFFLHAESGKLLEKRGVRRLLSKKRGIGGHEANSTLTSSILKINKFNLKKNS